jgi:hypothetical protein
MNFVADRIVQDKAYPALATWSAQPYTPQWRQFGQHYPYTIPMDLYEHCRTHQVEYTIEPVEGNHGGYYGIAIQFFEFGIDYIGLLSDTVKQQLRNGQLHLLFYYDEGDNPKHIKTRLDELCQQHAIPVECYHFISANTAAEQLPRFHYLSCDELLYWHRNREVAPVAIHTRPRPRDFTVLNRTHKWWRVSVMADLHRNKLLENSYWSYRTDITINDLPEDNPIEIDELARLRWDIDRFIKGAPYACDELTADEHNDHHRVEQHLFDQSYCHIVLETHFDADGSGGAFLTEKTFKTIKHGQPFIIVGAAGSLAKLRELGYRTFDHALDNSYDLETNNTERWRKILKLITDLKKQDLHSWFLSCLSDAKHNQQLFAGSKANRLNNLLERLK